MAHSGASADRARLLEYVLSNASEKILWPPEDLTATQATRVSGHPVDLEKVAAARPAAQDTHSCQLLALRTLPFRFLTRATGGRYCSAG